MNSWPGGGGFSGPGLLRFTSQILMEQINADGPTRCCRRRVDKEKHEAYVGSNNPKARWHELGTSRIHARSFIMGAGMRKADEIHKLVGAKVHLHIAGRDEPGESSTPAAPLDTGPKGPENPSGS
jgi:hypothetical protein